MSKFFSNAFFFGFAALILMACLILIASNSWDEFIFQKIYTFLSSAGLLALSFYFLILSAGSNSARIRWGLTFLALSLAVFFLNEKLIFGDGLDMFSPWGGSDGGYYTRLEYGGTPRETWSFLSSTIHGVPIHALLLIAFLALNGLLISKGSPARKFIGGNVLLMVLVVIFKVLADYRIWQI